MIAVVFGTTGEVIKLAPVLRRLTEIGHPPLLITTAQQTEQVPVFLSDLGLPPADVLLADGFRGRDLERPWQIPAWAATVAGRFLRRRSGLRRRLDSDGRRPLVVVHGDTMTSVVGAVIGRALRAPVAHIEAGMRSGNWRDPFPEEIARRTVARLAHVHFAPGPRPVANLERERVRGRIVDTHLNTIRDALDLALDGDLVAVDVPDEPFGLVSLHRFELVERPELLRPALEILHEHSRREPLLFIDHSTTAAALRTYGLEGYFDERFRRVPRQRYVPFISLLRRSRFLVSDSGGCQEECAFLGHPCLIHRAVSEHDTGLDGSVVLSRLDLAILRDFLADPDSRRVPAQNAAIRPTDVIVADLQRMGAL